MTSVLETIEKFKNNNHWHPRVIYDFTKTLITDGADEVVDATRNANRPYNIEDMYNIFGMVYPNTHAVLSGLGCSFFHGIPEHERFQFGPDIEIPGSQIHNILFQRLKAHDLSKLMLSEELFHTRCTKMYRTNKKATKPTGVAAIKDYLRNNRKATLTDFFCKAKKVIVGEWELREFSANTRVDSRSATVIVNALCYNGNRYRWGSYGSYKLDKARYYVLGFTENYNSHGKYTRYIAQFVLCNEILRTFRFKSSEERTEYLSTSYPFPLGMWGSYIYHDRIALFHANYPRVYGIYSNFIPETL